MSSLPYAARRLAEITQRSPMPEIDGELSQDERRFAPEAEAREREAQALEDSARYSAQEIHEKATQRAVDARERLKERIGAAFKDDAQRAAAFVAIDAHARAQCWLRDSAQGVCDAFDMADNGKAAGIVWETPLGSAR